MDNVLSNVCLIMELSLEFVCLVFASHIANLGRETLLWVCIEDAKTGWSQSFSGLSELIQIHGNGSYPRAIGAIDP